MLFQQHKMSWWQSRILGNWMGVNGVFWSYVPWEGGIPMVSYSSMSTEGREISSNDVFLCRVCLGKFREVLIWCVWETEWDMWSHLLDILFFPRTPMFEGKTIPRSRNGTQITVHNCLCPCLWQTLPIDHSTPFQKPCTQPLPIDCRVDAQSMNDFLPLLGKEGYSRKALKCGLTTSIFFSRNLFRAPSPTCPNIWKRRGERLHFPHSNLVWKLVVESLRVQKQANWVNSPS